MCKNNKLQASRSALLIFRAGQVSMLTDLAVVKKAVKKDSGHKKCMIYGPQVHLAELPRYGKNQPSQLSNGVEISSSGVKGNSGRRRL